MAIVLPDLSAIGAQRYVLGIAKRLTRFNIDYCVMLQSGSGEFSNEIENANRVVFGYRTFSRLIGIRTIESIVRLATALRRGRFDYVYSISPFLNRIVCLLGLARLIRATTIIEEHGYPPMWLNNNRGEIASWWILFYGSTYWLYRSASRIRVMTEGILDFYHSIGIKDNVILFPNLIDLKRIVEMGNEDPVHALAREKLNVVYFGRLIEQKNVSFLLESFAELAQRGDVHLTIIGTGDEEERLKEITRHLLIESRVTFLGFVSNPYPIIRRADVMALTSVWEGAPQVLVEAMVLGTAVVARDCPTGPSEMIGAKSERGWLVPYDADLRAFAFALRQALGDREARAHRVAAAREFAFREYDIDRRLVEQVRLFWDGPEHKAAQC